MHNAARLKPVPELLAPDPSNVQPAAALMPKRLWMGVYLPQFPLEAQCRRDDAASPLAVVDGDGVRPPIVAVNRRADALGAHAGMRLSAAYALAPVLEVIRRDPSAEAAALEGLAAWGEQFTSLIILVPPAGLLLEVGGSLELFGGLDALTERLRAGVEALGYSIATGIAPTALAAWLLARAGFAEPVTGFEALPGRLAGVPVSCLELPERAMQDLRAMGLKCFGDCYRPPRDGVSRRIDPMLVDIIDRALGRCPDARRSYVAPVAFERRIGFPGEVCEIESVLFGARRLLLELTGFLSARALGVQGLEVHLAHRHALSTRITIELVGPSRDSAHLLHLLEVRLNRVELMHPVEHLGLRALNLVPLAPENRDLYGAKLSGESDWRILVERLKIRLEADAVRGLALVADHRPERAWRYVTPGEKRGLEKRGLSPFSISASITSTDGDEKGDSPLFSNPLFSRPASLLDTPQRLESRGEDLWHRGRLEILAGPERIESGWWDGDDVIRDYYLARNRSGERFWIFRDRRDLRHWFLHGVFG